MGGGAFSRWYTGRAVYTVGVRRGFSQPESNLSHDCRKAFPPLSQGEPRTIARDPMGLNRGQVDRDVADGLVETAIAGGEC